MPATIFETSSGDTCARRGGGQRISSWRKLTSNDLIKRARTGGARTSKPADAAHMDPSVPQIAPWVTCPVPKRWSST